MAKIGGKFLHSKGYGTVFWYWTDDGGQLLSDKLKTVLYFPDSPINILSATDLSGSMQDFEGIRVLTRIKYSVFTWYFG